MNARPIYPHPRFRTMALAGALSSILGLVIPLSVTGGISRSDAPTAGAVATVCIDGDCTSDRLACVARPRDVQDPA